MVTGEFLIISGTAIAVNAAVHLMLNQGSQILIIISALRASISSYSVTAGDGHILEQAVSSFVTNRAIVGMIEHQPFNDGFSKLHGFFVRGGHDHAVLGLNHTAHLNTL